jgi:hypothetical protein
MSNYLTQAIHDVTVTATSHQLAAEHYQSFSQFIKYPQAIGPVLVMIVSFIGLMMGDNHAYYFYANEALSLLCLLTVAIDQYFGWSKLSVSHANVATQYFQVRDRLNRLKRQQLIKAQSVETIQPAVEKIEENYMVLLHKHRRPPTSFQHKALEVMRSTQSLVAAIEQRRHSESHSKERFMRESIRSYLPNQTGSCPTTPIVAKRATPTLSSSNQNQTSTPPLGPHEQMMIEVKIPNGFNKYNNTDNAPTKIVTQPAGTDT